MTSVLIITTIRDEGPFLLDWIAHHRAIGVTDFLIYSNDCTDGSPALLDRLQDTGIIHHVPQEIQRNKTPQWQALKAAWSHPACESADWILVIDCDEYISLAPNLPDLSALIAACPPEMDALTLGWRFFGNDGIAAFEDRPVTAQFLKAAPEPCPFPLNATYFKTLLRNSKKVQKLGVHRPKFKSNPRHGTPVWVDGSGRTLPDGFSKNEGLISLLGQSDHTDLVRLNHYSLRAAESFLVKRARGLPNHTEREIDLAYWVERNFNTEEDTRIQACATASQQERYKLAALDGVSAAHERCVKAHRDRIDEMLLDRDMIYFLSRLMLAPNTPVLSSDQANVIYALHRRAIAAANKGEKTSEKS